MSSHTLAFWDHVSELRNTLLKCLLVIAVGVLCAFAFYQEIFAVLSSPLNSIYGNSSLQRQEIRKERIYNQSSKNSVYLIPVHAELSSFSPGVYELSSRTFQIPPKGHLEIDIAAPQNDLVVLGPLDGIITCFKVCLWVGFVGTSPFWIFFLLQFIIPALHPHERSLMLPFTCLSFVFLTFGFLFAYFITVPAANHYLTAFNQGIARNFWSLSSYLDYSLSLLLANAFAFEVCIVLLFLVHHRFFSTEALINKRRHVAVASFVIGALLTPPDVLTQLMLAIPLIALYELTILYSRILPNYK